MHISTITTVAAVLAQIGLASTETQDTLQAVKVVADRGVVVSRTDTVQTANSISITDALAGIPGVYITDNGGPAGLKTASIRAMGSANTVIYADGVRVSSVQSGQADLGMFDIVADVAVVIDYAQNSISFNTAKPVFGEHPTSGYVRLRGGSFGTCESSGRLNFRLSDKVSLSAMAGGVLSRGDFPLPDGSRRLNNDIGRLRTGVDAWGTLSRGDWHVKAGYNDARRGTPGTAQWQSSDRQHDRNAFVQGVVHKRLASKYTLYASARLSADEMEYSGEWVSNRYSQTGIQFNSAHKFNICGWLDASLSVDLERDALRSDMYDNARTSLFATISAAFHPERFKAVVSLEYVGTSDSAAGGGQKKRSILCPSVDLRWRVAGTLDLLAFARRAYRTPTFNELYYPGFGNSDLVGEDACLADIGLEYTLPLRRNWRLRAKADGFFNRLKDKIVSAPTVDDPNIWLPYNVGLVQMAGTDVSVSADYAGSILHGSLSARYSYQDALDKTPGSLTFAQQIPFISKHSLALGADVFCKGLSASVQWNGRALRYDSNGRMPDFDTLDITVGKDFNKSGISLKLIARNLTDSRYELAAGYPMPGRAFYVQTIIEF